MALICLTDAVILDPEAREAGPGSLLLESGRIAAVLGPEARVPDGARICSLDGHTVAPGFIDLHVHGELVSAPPETMHDALAHDAASMVRHGVTGFLATTVAWAPERLRSSVDALAAAVSAGVSAGATPVGIHLEGPWINPKAAGAQPKSGIRAYDASFGENLMDRAEGTVRMVTLAPEVEGSRSLLEGLQRRGIVAALGHSLADDASLDASCGMGMTHVTHLFNAMGVAHHREPGVPGFALGDDRLTCDLICDGVHVHPRMMQVAARAKGDRLVLITDRISPPTGPDAGAGFGSGALRDAGDAIRLDDGRLAGSNLTLDRALRNAREMAGLSLIEAVSACSFRPARVLGIESDRGSLRPGARADLVVLDGDLAVAETWLAGRRVWARAPTGAG